MRAGLQFMTFFAILTIHVGSAQHELDCGDGVFTNSSGFIHLPTNPTDHSVNINCTYTILANNNSVISLGVFSSELPSLLDSFVDCNRDYITVGCVSETETELKQDTSITYCSHSFDFFSVHPSRIIFSNCSTVKIFVRASDYNYRESYAIPFTVFSAYDEDCGTTFFTDPTGFVNSPRFPLSYPHSLDCVYSIYVDRTKTITFYFLSFTIEGPSEFFFKHDLCWGSWVTVGCLLDDGSVWRIMHPDWKFCSEKAKPWSGSLYDCEYLIVNFVSNSSVNKGDFQLQYAVTSPENTPELGPEKDRVNATFTGPTGFITSPQFPLSYPINVDYYYSIDVDRTKVVGLYFHSFSLEAALFVEDPHSCQYDVLIISCLSETSSSRRVIRYCGEKPEQPIRSFSKCESLTLNFFSDSSVTRGGFKIWYSIGQSGCGKTLHSGPNGVVTSPNFPLPYPQNHNCTYSINVAQKSSVLLRFEYFEMEGPDSSGDCGTSWLLITCCDDTSKTNPKSNLKYCGDINWTSSMRFVDCSCLVLKFSSGFSYYSKSGFMILYTVIENSKSTAEDPGMNPTELDCGATLFTDSSGEIILPRNSMNYLATVNCTYTITINQRSIIWLNASLDEMIPLLQSFQDCGRQRIVVGCVSEGETEPNPNKSMILCRGWSSADYDTRRELVFPDCRMLKLFIFSNTYDYRGTFDIPFSVEQQNLDCGTTLFTNYSGVIILPRNPTNHLTSVYCTYTISANHLSYISLDTGPSSSAQWFQSFQNCEREHVMISCVPDADTDLNTYTTRIFCGDYRFPDDNLVVFVECRTLKLNVQSSTYANTQTIRIPFFVVGPDNVCGITSFSAPTGVVSTPQKLPYQYRKRYNCLYTIDIGQVNSIVLSVDRLDMNRFSFFFGSFCNDDWLKITCFVNGTWVDHPLADRKICGNVHGDFWTTTARFPACHSVLLNFTTYSIASGMGYGIRYRIGDYELDCGTTLFTNSSGVISIPGNPTDIPAKMNCTYTISANRMSDIWLQFYATRSILQSLQDCNTESLTFGCISEGESELNPNTSRVFCTDGKPVKGRDLPEVDAVFADCRTVKLSIRSYAYINRETFSIPFSVYETSKTAAMSVSTEIPFIESVECDVGCEINEDGTNCVCSTTHSEDVVASTQTNLSEEEPGRPSVKSVIIISLACVPPVVTLVAVCIVRS